MPDDSQIPADLTLVLRSALISDYGTAAETAQRAADDYPTTRGGEAPTPEHAAALVEARARLADLERLFEIVGGEDLVTGDDLAIPSDPIARRLLLGLVDRALVLESFDLHDGNPDADAIIDAGHLLARPARPRRPARAQKEPAA